MIPQLYLLPAAVLIGIALLAAGYRCWRGPGIADRVVALDLMAILAVGVMALAALSEGQSALADAGIVLGIVAFIGTLVLCALIQRTAEEPLPADEPTPDEEAQP